MYKIITIFFLFGVSACANEMETDKLKINAHYSEPVDIYKHNIFATPHEFAALQVEGGQVISAIDGSVFEGIEPLSFHAKAEDKNYIIATQSDFELGAYLTLYVQGDDGRFELVDQTKPIGRSHRWLALSFAQDIDGNGYPEIGYVETPHIGGTGKLFEIVSDKLAYRAEFAGVSNHKIGSDEITGGVNDGIWHLPNQAMTSMIELTWSGKKLTKIGERPITNERAQN